jgi:hypothetical protein
LPCSQAPPLASRRRKGDSAEPRRFAAGMLTVAPGHRVGVVAALAGVSPLAATVSPGSALLRSIAGPPAARAAPPAVGAAALPASPATGRGAVAMSASYRGHRGR